MNLLIKTFSLLLIFYFNLTIYANTTSNSQSSKTQNTKKQMYDKQFAQAIEYWFRGDVEKAKELMTAAADRGVKPAYWYSYILTQDTKYLILSAKNQGKRSLTDAAVALVNKTYPNTSFADYMTAYNWYLAATEEQLTEQAFVAMCNIGLMYFRGEGPLTADYNKAMEWYQKAADHLFPRAVREIGVKYCNMAAKTNNLSSKETFIGLGYSHFAMAALRGDERAKNLMNQPTTIKMPIADKNFVEAIKIYFEAKKFDNEVIKMLKTAAEQKHLFANILLGDYYSNSDQKLAVKYHQVADKQGSIYAKTRLARISSSKERIKYCKELTNLGYKMWRHNYAGELEKQGNTTEAYKIFQQNADAGDAHSQYRMFNLIWAKKIKDISIFKGFTYLIESSKQHFGDAEVSMGSFLTRDLLQISPEDSMTLLMKGIIDGVTTAQMYDFALGDIADGFACGYGVKKDAEYAKQICLERVKNKNTVGYLFLGLYYEKGVFGKPDIENAKKYYKLGADSGNESCAKALKRLNKK